jgi:flagellar basal body P-ring formation protein FlgA
MSQFTISLFAATLLCTAASALAMEWQDTTALKKIAEAYVRKETANLPGKVSISVNEVDPRLRLPFCPAPEAYTPSGTRLWSNASVGIRCTKPNWSLSIPINVRVMAEVVVAARSLARNQVIESTDVTLREVDLTQLPTSTLTDMSQAVGKLAGFSISAGTPLKNELLRAPLVIRQGQKVTLQARGAGFKVNTEGQALGDGRVGDSVSVRTTSGKVVSGVIKSPGVVEVIF